ncbi:hypothetical protein OAL19_00390 [bacterium]|nr:hypothetical protein [bacterium]
MSALIPLAANPSSFPILRDLIFLAFALAHHKIRVVFNVETGSMRWKEILL